MRKSILAVVLVAVVGLASAAAAAGETFGGLPAVRVIVNGKAMDMPGVIVEGRTMAPVRAVAESLGGTVSWDQATFTATILAPDVSQLQTEIAALKKENAELKARLQPAAPSAEQGSTRTNPAGLNVTQTVAVSKLGTEYTAKVTLLDVIRGDAAWQQVKVANVFNDPAKDGKEYIIAKFRFELLTSAGDKAIDLSAVHFTAFSGAGREYDWPMVVEPEPKIGTSLYAGSSHEGWVVFEVDKTDTVPVVAYGRKYDGTGGIWFKLSK